MAGSVLCSRCTKFFVIGAGSLGGESDRCWDAGSTALRRCIGEGCSSFFLGSVQSSTLKAANS